MQESLRTVLSYVDRPEDCSSPVMVIANQDDYPDEAYQVLPTVAQIEETAREVGEYIGKQEKVSTEDVDVLVDILLAVSQMAFDTENALMVDAVEDETSGNEDISKFFENSLNFTKVFILQPLINGIRTTDVNTNLNDFRNICDTALELWSVTVENISEAYVKADKRLKKVLEHAFASKADLAQE